MCASINDLNKVREHLRNIDWINKLEDNNPIQNTDFFIGELENAVKNNIKKNSDKPTSNNNGNHFKSNNFIPRPVRSLYKSKARHTKQLRKAKCLNRVLSIRNKIIKAELELSNLYNNWKQSKEKEIFEDSKINKQILYRYIKSKQSTKTTISTTQSAKIA